MSSSRNLVVHIAIIVFVFHGITSGDHVKKWLRLPNVIASPHIKNQSLTVCTGKNYVSLSTEASPRHVKCGLPFSLYIHMIPISKGLLKPRMNQNVKRQVTYVKTISDLELFIQNNYGVENISHECPWLEIFNTRR
ncbi:hypothetical protein AC249_AIPGENE22210 [Exaiptasia diaphana]|nr:hypothetical protein AC249_AIPGENE22210 [Exaiptasia diaphana]